MSIEEQNEGETDQWEEWCIESGERWVREIQSMQGSDTEVVEYEG